MKKIISTIMLLAASAAAFISCDKQNTVTTPSAEESVFVFTSEKPSFDDDVKTEWNEAENTVYWSKGDKIRMAYTINGVWQGGKGSMEVDEDAKLYESVTLKSSTAVASFSVPIASTKFNEVDGDVLETGAHVFYSVYPSECSEVNFDSEGVAKIKVAASQVPSDCSFDSSSDIMIGKSVGDFDCIQKDVEIPLKWNRLVAHAMITLEGINGAVVGEKVNSIVLTAQDGANLTGNYKVNLITGVVTGDGSNELTVLGTNLPAVDESGNVIFWACMMPCTWESLTVVVDTDKATYTREIDLTGKEKTFLQNRRNLLTINMSEATREEKVVGETYTVVSKVANLTPGTYYMGGNNQKKFSDSTTMYLWDGTVDGAELGTGPIVFTGQAFQSEPASFAVITLESAGSENSYNIKVGDMYLNASGTTLSLLNTTFPWTIEDLTDDKEGMVLVSDECKVSINSTSCIKAYSGNKYKGLYFFKKN